MFEEVFIDDVLNEIDRRSDEVIERFGIDPDRNCWVITQGIESFDSEPELAASAQLIFELEDKTIGMCLIEVYEEDGKYIIFAYNKDFIHRATFGCGDASVINKDQLAQTVGEITHNFVNTILDKGV